ncbi:hypothetical protein FOB64_001083 [Candida albicans]|uniref:Uncharacterized protein n=1 Tax=Candida albicans TaxID=5476 RepID=A0A8H6F6B1_CANAX|nr:hypothetical protein FOB64_001083 [Candida albicans]
MKFYKIASFAFLALLSQAAVAQYDLETKKDVVAANADGTVGFNLVGKREVSEGEISKRFAELLLIPVILVAIKHALPEIIKIASALLEHLPDSGSVSVNATLLAEISAAITTVQQQQGQQQSQKVKRDTIGDIVNEIIAEGEVLVPEVVAFLERVLPEVVDALLRLAPALLGGLA